MRIAPTCTPTKATASAPRNRCRLRIHAGVGRRPSARVARRSPHTIPARSSPHETNPLARAAYQVMCDDMAQLPPVLVCGLIVLLDEDDPLDVEDLFDDDPLSS